MHSLAATSGDPFYLFTVVIGAAQTRCCGDHHPHRSTQCLLNVSSTAPKRHNRSRGANLMARRFKRTLSRPPASPPAADDPSPSPPPPTPRGVRPHHNHHDNNQHHHPHHHQSSCFRQLGRRRTRWLQLHQSPLRTASMPYTIILEPHQNGDAVSPLSPPGSPQVPSMPIVSDPQLFLEVLENKRIVPTKGSPGKVPPTRRMHNYAKRFQHRSFRGDQRRGVNLLRILQERFGEDNRQLVLSLFDHFTSNVNWRESSIIYRIDRCSSCQPDLTHNPNAARFKKREKLWADLWEAEWDAIFRERELFNDSLEGIYSIIRWLVAFRYRLLGLFCTDQVLEMPAIPRLSSKFFSVDDVTLTTVDPEHTLVEKCTVISDKLVLRLLTWPQFPLTNRTINFLWLLVPRIRPKEPSLLMCTHRREQGPKPCASQGQVSRVYPPPTFKVMLILAWQENFFEVIYSKRTEENVLQAIFDTMVDHWLGKPTPLSSDVIRPIDDYIHQLLREMHSTQPCHFDHRETLQPRLSWYEVQHVEIIIRLTSLVESRRPARRVYSCRSSCVEGDFLLRSSYACHENLIGEVNWKISRHIWSH